jgi:sugar phosphate isomerase/epimerase
MDAKRSPGRVLLASPMVPKISFSTLGCPDWSWDQIVARGVEYGFDGVEVRQIAGETDLRKAFAFSPPRSADVRADLERRGFAICGLGSSVRFDYPEAGERAEQLQIGREYIDLAAGLGAGFIRVFGDVLPPGDPQQQAAVVKQIADGLNALGSHAAERGIEVLLETHGDFAASSRVVELFAAVESPAVGIVWDTHHPWRFFQEPLWRSYKALVPWIRHTHWKDSVDAFPESTSSPDESARVSAAARAHSLMSGHRPAHYVLFGTGQFPAAECARLLKQGGYRGWLSLEWEKMWHPEIEDPETAFPAFAKAIRELWTSTSL